MNRVLHAHDHELASIVSILFILMQNRATEQESYELIRFESSEAVKVQTANVLSRARTAAS
jgi:hypothetical protein